MKRLEDGVCPADFYSKREIAEYEGIPADRMAQYARDTLGVLEKIAAAEGFADLATFSKHYNTVKNGLVTDKEINHFYWHRRLEPFAHLFRLFVRRRKATKGSAVHLYADFGVRKSYYEEYKRSGKLPNVLNMGRLPKHGPATGRSKVEFAGGGRVDLPMNPVYKRFKAGIDAANAASSTKVTVPDVVLAAIGEYMEKRPAVFNEALSAPARPEPVRRTNTSLYIEGLEQETVEGLYCFLQRYYTATGQQITMRQFVEAAIKAHLERMPLV